MKIVRCMLLGMGLGDMFCVCGFPLFNHIINNLAILPPVYRIAMELYEAVSRRMGIPEVVIRIFMGYMRQFRIFVVTFLGVLDPIQRTISTPQV